MNWLSLVIWDTSASAKGATDTRGMKVARADPVATGACVSRELDERTEPRPRALRLRRLRARLKSESLQKDRRSPRYYRFGDADDPVEAIWSLTTPDAFRSVYFEMSLDAFQTPRSLPRRRRRTNRRPVRANGESDWPASEPRGPRAFPLRVRRPEPCRAPRPRSRANGSKRARAQRSSGTPSLPVASLNKNIFGGGTRVNLKLAATKSS